MKTEATLDGRHLVTPMQLETEDVQEYELDDGIRLVTVHLTDGGLVWKASPNGKGQHMLKDEARGRPKVCDAIIADNEAEAEEDVFEASLEDCVELLQMGLPAKFGKVHRPSEKKKRKGHVIGVTEEDQPAMATLRITANQELDLATPCDSADSSQRLDLPWGSAGRGAQGGTSPGGTCGEGHVGHVGGDGSHPGTSAGKTCGEGHVHHMGGDSSLPDTSPGETCGEGHVGPMGGDGPHPESETCLDNQGGSHLGSGQWQSATSAAGTGAQQPVDVVGGEGLQHEDNPAMRDAAMEMSPNLGSDPGALWQEAYDPGSDSYYYYRESTQETQWHPPAEGYTPAPYYWTREAHQRATGMFGELPAATGTHTYFDSPGSEAGTMRTEDVSLPCFDSPETAKTDEPSEHAPHCATANGAILADTGMHMYSCACDLDVARANLHACDLDVAGDAASAGDVANFGTAKSGTMQSEGSCRAASTGTTPDVDLPEGMLSEMGILSKDGILSKGRGPASDCSGMGPVPLVQKSDVQLSGNGAHSIFGGNGAVDGGHGTDEPGAFLAHLPKGDFASRESKLLSGEGTVEAGVDMGGRAKGDVAFLRECEHGGAELLSGIDDIDTRGDMAGLTDPVPSLRESSQAEAALLSPATVQKQRSRAGRSRGFNGPVPPDMVKYWLQRYSLWSRYDEGVEMDPQGWYSATPEVIARHQADWCGASQKLVVDAFAGAGGNTVQFALRHRVVAIDIHWERLANARSNAAVYHVQDRVEFICADFFAVAPQLKADCVFLSPPWGGPAYCSDNAIFNLEDLGGTGMSLALMISSAVQALQTPLTGSVILFLPRNTPLQQIKRHLPPRWGCCVERNVLNGRLKAITLYCSALKPV